MRVLLQTWGSRGDVQPMVALAAALNAAGAEARVCAPPDDQTADQLRAVGATQVPFGRSVRELVAGPTKLEPEKAAPAVAEALVNEFFDTALPAAEGCDAIVVSGLMPAGARSVAEKLGIGYVLAMFQALSLPSVHRDPSRRPGKSFPDGATREQKWEIDAERVNALYQGPLNRRRAEIGLAPVENVRDHVFGDRPWVATDPALDEYVHDLDVVQTGAWFAPDARPLPPDLIDFLDAGSPPVYVGFGSMPMRDPAVVDEVLKQLQGRRVVLSRGWAGLEAENTFVVGEVNHQALFPRVAAVVHHGGAGTTHAVTRAGVPHVIIPQMADQPYWAQQVARLGIGGDVGFALDHETRSRASGVSVRVDGATTAVRLLEEMIA